MEFITVHSQKVVTEVSESFKHPISVLTHDSAATGLFSSRSTYIFHFFRTRAGRQENMSGAERKRVRGGKEAEWEGVGRGVNA